MRKGPRIVPLHRVSGLTDLRVMPIAKFLGQLLRVLAGEDVAQTALHDERGTVDARSLPEAFFQLLAFRFPVCVAVPHPEISFPRPFAAGVLAKIVQQAAPQKPGITARVELNGFLDHLVEANPTLRFAIQSQKFSSRLLPACWVRHPPAPARQADGCGERHS